MTRRVPVPVKGWARILKNAFQKSCAARGLRKRAGVDGLIDRLMDLLQEVHTVTRFPDLNFHSCRMLRTNAPCDIPVVTSWNLNSQGTVPCRDGVQQAYLRLGTMFHARNPTQTDSTSRTCTALHLSGLPVQARWDRE
jgi:hypothetical protein